MSAPYSEQGRFQIHASSTLDREQQSHYNNVEMVSSTETTVKNVIQDSTQHRPAVIPIHVDLGKGQYAILRTTHAVRINVKSLLQVLFVEQQGTRRVIFKRPVMEVQPIVQKTRRRMMELIVGMDYLVPVEFVQVWINNVDNLVIR